MYGKGINKEAEILDLAVKFEIIKKSGSWFEYNGEKIGQGKENAKRFLLENEKEKEEIKNQIIEKIKNEK